MITTYLHRIAGCLFVAALVAAPRFALAQDDAFGDLAEEPMAEPAAEAPAEQPAASAPAPPAASLKLEPLAVRAVLESNPTTPDELVRAIETLLNLERPALAKPLVQRLIDAKLDPAAMDRLLEKHGSAVFLRMAETTELAPEGTQLADAILSSAEAHRSNPERLRGLVARLNDPVERNRQDAAVELLRSGSPAVGALVEVLADPARAAEHARVRAVLVRLGANAVGPLLAILDSPDALTRQQAILALSRIRARAAAPQLIAAAVDPQNDASTRKAASAAVEATLGQAPTISSGRTYLEREVKRRLDQAILPPEEFAAPVVVWQWDPAARQLVANSYRPDAAGVVTAAPLAASLHRIDPENIANRRLYLIALLESAKLRGGLDKALPPESSAYAQAVALGVDAVDDALAQALATGHTVAATAAAEILGREGTADLLRRAGADRSPLAEAARHADRRLRFAAMDAILRLAPQGPFTGSSAVAEALGYFASSAGRRRALVGHPRIEEGQKLAGMLTSLGFKSDLATNSRDFFNLATSSADYEVAFVYMTLARPAVDELLAQLRKDERTASLPIGLIAVPEDLPTAERIARGVSLTEAAPQAQELATVESDVADLLAKADRRHVSGDERLRQAAVALDWMAALAETPQTLFDLRRQLPAVEQALLVPELNVKAALVLGNLGSPSGQRALVDLASRGTQPIEARQAAAVAFQRSVREQGILLTRDEILKQYDRYNASRTSDASTQAVLASILDTLEGKGSGKQVDSEE